MIKPWETCPLRVNSRCEKRRVSRISAFLILVRLATAHRRCLHLSLWPTECKAFTNLYGITQSPRLNWASRDDTATAAVERFFPNRFAYFSCHIGMTLPRRRG